MYSTICYEERLADISSGSSKSGFPIISYIQCSPPPRLKSKGVVVLLHGAFQTNYQFRHVIDIFAMAGFVTIAPNLPGKRLAFSTSDMRPVKPKSQLARDLRDFLRTIDIHEPVHIVGHGFGADIALRFALKYPSWTASVALSGKDFGRPSQGLSRLLERSVMFDLPSLTSALHSMTSNPAIFTRNDLEEYYETLTDADTVDTMRKHHSYHPGDSQDSDLAEGKHPPSKVPCLVLSGSEANGAQIQPVQKIVKTNFTGPLEFTSIDGAKMLLAEEQPEDFAIKILHFLHTAARMETKTSESGPDSAESDGLVAKL